MKNKIGKTSVVVSSNAKTLGNWIVKWGESIQEKTNEALDEIRQKARDIAITTLLQAYHTQKMGDELAQDIYIDGDTIYAGLNDTVQDMWYAEYGAGKVSETHPKANEIGWQYDIKGHGDKGWIYKTTPSDKNPRKIYSSYGMLAWTNSSRPARFMYKAGQWIEQNATKILERKMRSVKK